MKRIISDKLRAIELQFDVRILYACESGSRAWGFASPDSDYDVRFIYVHRMDHYLSIDDRRDVIELPVNNVLDINGWELRKALRLFRKSNVPLYEWLQSPVVYSEDAAFSGELKSMMASNFLSRAAMHHYLSMAKGVFKSELSEERVKLKKYFYALRPVLAAKWIADRVCMPPIDFQSLRVLMPRPIDMLVGEMLSVKVNVNETYLIESNADVNDFVEECIRYCEARVPEIRGNSSDDALNKLFQRSFK